MKKRADLSKTFQQNWAEDTYTGRALDTVMGGRLSAASRAQRAAKFMSPRSGVSDAGEQS